MDIQAGDVLRMKKPHPCGSLEFTVLRVGMDFKICNGCGREVMIPAQVREECEEGPPSGRRGVEGFSKNRISILERLCLLCLRICVFLKTVLKS